MNYTIHGIKSKASLRKRFAKQFIPKFGTFAQKSSAAAVTDAQDSLMEDFFLSAAKKY
jgi:hypothetical protein